jgi:hypothetical protein
LRLSDKKKKVIAESGTLGFIEKERCRIKLEEGEKIIGV